MLNCHSLLRYASSLTIAFALTTTVAAIEPPPEPDIKPIIPVALPEDSDHDGIEDQLLDRQLDTELELLLATSPENLFGIQAQLDATIYVELVFSRQVTQAQIDAFLAAGGTIDYLYRAVSYG